MGHDTRVLSPCDGPPPDAGVIPLGRSVPLASNGSVAPIAPDISCALRTIRALRDEHFDAVHLHEPLTPGPTMTALLFTDVPLVGTFHRAGLRNRYRVFKPYAMRASRRISIRAAVSKEAIETASQIIGGEFELLFNGVELDRFAQGPKLTKDGPTILFIGRHEPRKGLATLIEALAYLPRHVRLWVAGSGPQSEELRGRTLGDPRVVWLGRISDAEVTQRLRSADVFCAPSLNGESFGVVLLEALAAGTPVVASDLLGYTNVVRADRDALLVTPGDPRALGMAVQRVLDDGDLRRRLIASGLKRAEDFSMDRLAQRYLLLYEAIAADRR